METMSSSGRTLNAAPATLTSLLSPGVPCLSLWNVCTQLTVPWATGLNESRALEADNPFLPYVAHCLCHLEQGLNLSLCFLLFAWE